MHFQMIRQIDDKYQSPCLKKIIERERERERRMNKRLNCNCKVIEIIKIENGKTRWWTKTEEEYECISLCVCGCVRACVYITNWIASKAKELECVNNNSKTIFLSLSLEWIEFTIHSAYIQNLFKKREEYFMWIKTWSWKTNK